MSIITIGFWPILVGPNLFRAPPLLLGRPGPLPPPPFPMPLYTDRINVISLSNKHVGQANPIVNLIAYCVSVSLEMYML